MYFEVMTSTSLNKIPTKNILKDVSPWPKEYSNEFLRLNELSLLFTRTNCDEDENEPFYFFATPDESVLWPNGKPVCPKCEKAGYPSTLTKIHAYEAKARQIEDIPFRGKKSIIAILYKTYRCTHCADQGITTIIRPAYTFVEKNGKLTKRHIEKIKAASLGKTSFEQVAYQMQVDAKTVKKLFKEEVLRRQKECKFATPKHLGIDEAKVHTAGKSTFYVCLMNTDPNAPEHNGIVDILQMKQTTEETVKLLSRFDDPGTVETISMDMCSAYRTAAETVFPKARIIVDRFHLVQSLNNKFKECLSLLYADYKDTLEKRLKITPSCHSGDTFLDDDEKVIEEEAALLRADLDMAYEHISGSEK